MRNTLSLPEIVAINLLSCVFELHFGTKGKAGEGYDANDSTTKRINCKPWASSLPGGLDKGKNCL
jgi:hypothetical protein